MTVDREPRPTSRRYSNAIARLEGDQRLDACVSSLQPPARDLDQSPVRSALGGKWLGHALRPLLTDFPLGFWIGSGLLDLLGGRRRRPVAQQLASR